MTAEPFAVQVDGGYELDTPMGDPIRVKAGTRDTHGSMTVTEFLVAAKNGPGAHIHFREDELWYVIEGKFRFKAGDAMLHASTGGFAFGPRGRAACLPERRRRGWPTSRHHDTLRARTVLRSIRRSATWPHRPGHP